MHIKLGKLNFLVLFTILISIKSVCPKTFRYDLEGTLQEDDSFIIKFVNQKRYSHCSLLTLEDHPDNRKNTLIANVTSAIQSLKTVYSINLVALQTNRVNSTVTERFVLKSISNFRKRSDQCIIAVLTMNNIKAELLHLVFELLSPVLFPIIRKNEDFFIFKTEVKYHKKLLLLKEFPNKIKYKIAIGLQKKNQDRQVKVVVSTVCFFCRERGKPRLVHLPVATKNLPLEDMNYFPDFVWNFNGKLLWVSIPLIRSKIDIFPQFTGRNNAMRGNWKTLFNEFLTVRFNFTYKMFISRGINETKGRGGTGLRLPNGTWIGVTGDVIAGEADIGIGPTKTPIRMEYIGFTNSFFDVGCLRFVTAQPKEIFSPAAFLWPFDPLMWLGIGLATLVSIAFFLFCFKTTEALQLQNHEKWSLSAQIQFILSTFLDQDFPILPKSHSVRSFIIFWIFFTMVLTNVYRSKMVSLLAFPVLTSVPKSFEELAFSGYQVGFLKHGDSAYNSFAASTDRVYSKLFAEMEILHGVGLSCLEKVVNNPKYGCIAYDYVLAHLTERNLSESDARRTLIAPAKTYNVWLGLAMEPHSILLGNFDKMISLTRPFFLADIWEQIDKYYTVRLPKIKWWEATGQIDKLKHVEEDSDNLTLKHIAGSFYVLVAALLFSTLAFLHELLTTRIGVLKRF